MTEETKDTWFNKFDKLAKAARKLVPKDKGVERSFEQLKKMHQACQDGMAEAMDGQSLLELEVTKNLAHIETWEHRAHLALVQGNESLATQSLQRKASFMQSTLEYESQLPLMRLRRIHLHSRLEAVNTIVHRLLSLKELLAAMPQQKDIREELLAAIKNFIADLASFAKEAESQEPSFNKALATVETRIAKLEQRIAACAFSFKTAKPEQARELEETANILKASTEATIAKVQEHLDMQKAIQAQREAEKNEDSAWECRQLIWSDEKTIESLTLSLASLEKITQSKVASPT